MKRALFVSAFFPDDLDLSVYGVFMRMRMMLEALSAETDELEMLFFVRSDEGLQGHALARFESELNARWGLCAKLTLCVVPDRRRLARYLAAIIDARYAFDYCDECVAAIERSLKNEPELIFVDRLVAMWPLLSIHRALPPVVFELGDIDHLIKLRESRQPQIRKARKLYKLLRIPALVGLERRAMRLARSTFVCSERDRRYLARWLYPSGVEVVANAVDLPQVLRSTVPTMTVGYIGAFNYQPNVDAAEELVTRIWPIVRAQLPQAKLILAGLHPERVPSFKVAECSSDAGIEFAGLVTDVNQFYERVQLVCCPIRLGGGTRIKIIEAAAHGLPVVATPLAAEGLNFSDGVEIVLAERPEAIAHACAALLSNPVRCREFGTAARAKVTASYNRDDVISSVRTHLRRLAQPLPLQSLATSA